MELIPFIFGGPILNEHLARLARSINQIRVVLVNLGDQENFLTQNYTFNNLLLMTCLLNECVSGMPLACILFLLLFDLFFFVLFCFLLLFLLLLLFYLKNRKIMIRK